VNIDELVSYFNYQFEPDEQAFIQLTGKEERGIRDKVASKMHINGKLVKRELPILVNLVRSQVDLAIYNVAEEVTDLIEFKLMYSWDLMWDHYFLTGRIGRFIENDFLKMVNCDLQCNQFVVFSVIHPKRKELFSDADLKFLPRSYFRDLNKFLKSNALEELNEELCLNKLSSRLSQYYSEIRHVNHRLGSYRECAVDLHHWIMKR